MKSFSANHKAVMDVFLPLSSQEPDWKELRDWTSELLLLLLPEKHVTSSAVSIFLSVRKMIDVQVSGSTVKKKMYLQNK